MAKYIIEFHVRRIEKYNTLKEIEADSLDEAKKKAEYIAENFCDYTFDNKKIIDMPEENASVFYVKEKGDK